MTQTRPPSGPVSSAVSRPEHQRTRIKPNLGSTFNQTQDSSGSEVDKEDREKQKYPNKTTQRCWLAEVSTQVGVLLTSERAEIQHNWRG